MRRSVGLLLVGLAVCLGPLDRAWHETSLVGTPEAQFPDPGVGVCVVEAIFPKCRVVLASGHREGKIVPL